MHLSTSEIFFYGFALAFWWVKYFMPWVGRARWILFPRRYKQPVIKAKPFACLKCMTGWLSFGLALVSGFGWLAVLVLFGGVLIGAIAEGLMMRYL